MRPKAPAYKRKPRRLICEGHLNAIRQLPCILSGRPAESAHISYGDLKHDKPHNAMGIKADDFYTVPLAPELHRLATGSQHDCGEREWWEQFGIDPVEVALRLWDRSPCIEIMNEIINGIVLTPEAHNRVIEILSGDKS